MNLRGTNPESYITEHALVYEDKQADMTCSTRVSSGAEVVPLREPRMCQSTYMPVIDSGFIWLSDRLRVHWLKRIFHSSLPQGQAPGSARAEDAQVTPTQSHLQPIY